MCTDATSDICILVLQTTLSHTKEVIVKLYYHLLLPYSMVFPEILQFISDDTDKSKITIHSSKFDYTPYRDFLYA